MARQKSVTPATAYAAAVRSALEHVADPQWLGRNSPLASPYFLGIRPSPVTFSDDPEVRGRQLQAMLHKTAAELWGGPLPDTRRELAAAVDEERTAKGSKSPRYRYYLLELRYLRRHYPPSTFPVSAEAIAGYVNVSPTRFFVHLEEAIDELAQRLRDRLNPALRLERPELSVEPVGRAAAIDSLLQSLMAGRSAAVTGAGGVGKTTVGAALIGRWPDEVFWHTFRPGLNDDLNSLLFNLGHFLHGAGAPTLWAQLTAGQGKVIPPDQALGMLRLDLETLAERHMLLCFDEMDMLQTSAADPRRRQHAQVLELIEGLRGLVPLLLVGQRVYIDTDDHVALEALQPAQTGEVLRHLGLDPDAATLQRVQQFTGGNPRLLELFAALVRGGDDAGDVLQLARAPSARPLFNRLWRRLDQPERDLLSALAVFRTYAPGDIWAGYDDALASLTARKLIKTDLAGGVALLPFFRDLVYAEIQPVRRQELHRNAAVIRSQFSDYTAAAFHFHAAGDPATAVRVWYAHQDQEILAGQAAAAGEVFRDLDFGELDPAIRAELRVIQNRLALMAGEYDRILAGMEKFSWDAEDEIVAKAIGQWAIALTMRDLPDDALARYEDAILMLSRISAQTIGWRLRRGLILSETDAKAAHNEALLARFDIEELEGTIDFSAGRYESARHHLIAALQIAEALNDEERIALAHKMLTLVAGRQGRIDAAQLHAEKAMSYYSKVGRLVMLEGTRAELAGIYLNVRQFEAVIEPSEKALAFFERIRHELWIAHISANLAEAYMETGRLTEAKDLVFKILRMEIAHTRPNALYTLGHIHDREGNATFAATSFAEGIEVARANGDPFLEAYLQRALGALQVRVQQTIEGVAHLETAARLFTDMGLAHEAKETETLLQAANQATY